MSGAPLSVMIYAAAACALAAIALYGFAARKHLLRRILSLNILSAAIFLMLVALARREAEAPPDPILHAMVLTGIVVAVSASALALVVMRRIHDVTGSAHLPDGDPADG